MLRSDAIALLHHNPVLDHDTLERLEELCTLVEPVARDDVLSGSAIASLFELVRADKVSIRGGTKWSRFTQHGSTAILDERDARRAGKTMGLDILGTLGALVSIVAESSAKALQSRGHRRG